MPKDEQGWRRVLRQEDQLQVEEELTGLPIFADCNPDILKALAERMLTKNFAQGQPIVYQGSAASSMMLVRHGLVRIFVCGVEVGTMTAVSCFGETVLLELESKWTVTLKADGLCTIGEITREDFKEALEKFPEESKWYTGILGMHKAQMSDGILQKSCEIFQGLSDEAMVSLDHALVRRLYFPGERFIEEGQDGDELYILVRGQVAIEIADRVVRQESVALGSIADPEVEQVETNLRKKFCKSNLNTTVNSTPVCFGELSLLGISSRRGASVRSQAVSQVRILYRSVFLSILQESAGSLDSDHIKHLMNKRYGNQQTLAASATTLMECPIFKELGCSKGFLDFLAQHLEDRIYLMGQNIVVEGSSDDRSMYILNSGKAKVLQSGRLVATLGDGSVFGEVVLFGISRERSSTVVCDTLCHTQVLHQNVVIRGLELFPNERQKVLMIAFSRTAGVEKDTQKSDEKSDAMSVDEKHRQSIHLHPDDLKAVELKVVMKAVKSSHFFSGLSQAFIEALGAVSTNRIYMPGDVIIEEGARGDSMFIMVSGSAAVLCTDVDESHKAPGKDKESLGVLPKSKVGILNAGSISGELSMLGVSQTRSATIEAETICCMWEISHDSAVPIIDRFPDIQELFAGVIVHHLQHTVPTLIDSLPLFKGFDRKFRMLLGLYCDRDAYFPNQKIFMEATPGHGLYIVNLGRAMLERKGIVIKSYSSGSHFNSNIMLGLGNCCLCTLTAIQTCHVVVISRHSFLQALELYPNYGSAQKIMKEEYVAHEEFKKQIQRLVLRTNIWKRVMAGTPHPDSDGGIRKTETQYLRHSFKLWLKHSQLLRTNRMVCDKQRELTDLWIVKKKEAIARRKDKEHKNRLRSQGRKPLKEKKKRREESQEESEREREKVPLLPVINSPRPPSHEQDTTLPYAPPPEAVLPVLPVAPSTPGRPPLTPGQAPSTPNRAPATPRLPATPRDGTTQQLSASDSLTSLKGCQSNDSLKSVKDRSLLQSRYKELSSIYLNWRQKLNAMPVREKSAI